MKRLLSFVVMLATALTGCGSSTASIPVSPIALGEVVPVPSPTPISSTVPVTSNYLVSDIPGLENNATSAIAPSTISIDNFKTEVTVSWQLIIHNGDGLKNRLIQIETEPNETVAAIPLKAVLANNGLLDIVAIESTLGNEHLEAIAYDAANQLMTIKGFIPSTKRIVKITYRTISRFTAYYREPSIFKEGFECPPAEVEKWITFDSPAILLRPMENGIVVVSLSIPKDTMVDKEKWLFWIGVTEEELGQSARVATRVELCQRILVTMRR